MRVNVDAVTARAVLFARALGMLFLVYFLPVVIRDVAGSALPGGGILGLFSGEVAAPFVPLALCAATLALSILFVVLFDRRSGGGEPPLLRFDAPYFRRWGFGFLAGTAIVVLAHVPLALAGVVRIDMLSSTAALRPGLAVAIFLALLAESWREELAFRGPSQRDLTRVAGFPFAAFFLAGTFTLLHLANPNAAPGTLVGVFLAGMALAGVVRAEGDLALAAGLHAGWNVALGMIVSLPVSGIRLGARLLETRLVGDPLWTGGRFGFESSLPGIALLFAAGFFAWKWSSKPRV